MLPLTPKLRISDDVVARILHMLRNGDYSPGDRLPGERPLAEQLGVSRTSIRSAIERLMTLGLLEARAGSGTFVKSPGSELIQAALVSHIFQDAETMNNLFDLREIIEVEAAARAAKRATTEQVSIIRHWAEQIESSVLQKDRAGLVHADVEFHRQIVIATGNSLLVDLTNSITHLLYELRYASTANLELLPGQRAVLTAIECQDSTQARLAMVEHLQTVRRKAAHYLESIPLSRQ